MEWEGPGTTMSCQAEKELHMRACTSRLTN